MPDEKRTIHEPRPAFLPDPLAGLPPLTEDDIAFRATFDPRKVRGVVNSQQNAANQQQRTQERVIPHITPVQLAELAKVYGLTLVPEDELDRLRHPKPKPEEIVLDSEVVEETHGENSGT